MYGALVTDPTDLQTVSALTEHWLHPGVHKREHGNFCLLIFVHYLSTSSLLLKDEVWLFSLTGQYHIPSLFFTPNTRLQALVQAVESAYPPLAYTAELCGIHYTTPGNTFSLKKLSSY